MKVFLIQPPYGYATGAFPNIKKRDLAISPLIPILLTVIQKTGHKPFLVDFDKIGWRLRDFANFLHKEQPEVICISTTTNSYCFVKAISRFIRSECANTKIILGGPHPTFSYEDILRNNEGDFIIRREGEISLRKLLHYFEGRMKISKIPGLVYRKNGKMIKNNFYDYVEIEKLGLPDYSLFDLKSYCRTRAFRINTMRGCPNNCRFCLIPEMNNFCPRMQSAEKVFHHLSYLYEKFKIRHFAFTDPIFTLSKKRVIELCRMLRENSVNIFWGCATRLDHLDAELVRNMSQGGCDTIFIGIESLSSNSLRLINKGKKYSNLLEKFDMLYENNINLIPSFIMGLPGQSKYEILRDIGFAEKIQSRYNLQSIQYNTFGPFPGTGIMKKKRFYKMKIRTEIDPSYYVVIPAVESNLLPYKEHIKLWHNAWETIHPYYYEKYLEIERQAFEGDNILLEKFIEGIF